MYLNFDPDELARITAAMEQCPREQHAEIRSILHVYRIHAAILQSILDGHAYIVRHDADGLHFNLTPAGRQFAEETLYGN